MLSRDEMTREGRWMNDIYFSAMNCSSSKLVHGSTLGELQDLFTFLWLFSSLKWYPMNWWRWIWYSRWHSLAIISGPLKLRCSWCLCCSPGIPSRLIWHPRAQLPGDSWLQLRWRNWLHSGLTSRWCNHSGAFCMRRDFVYIWWFVSISTWLDRSLTAINMSDNQWHGWGAGKCSIYIDKGSFKQIPRSSNKLWYSQTANQWHPPRRRWHIHHNHKLYNSPHKQSLYSRLRKSNKPSRMWHVHQQQQQQHHHQVDLPIQELQKSWKENQPTTLMLETSTQSSQIYWCWSSHSQPLDWLIQGQSASAMRWI